MRESTATSGSFHPAVDTDLKIGQGHFRVCEHPVARGQAFVQEGRAGRVFQLTDGQKKIALKVFHPPLRDPSLVEVAEALRGLVSVPGLQVCDFEVLHSRNNPDLLDRFPDLVYAMVMPWVDGPTWTEMVMSGKAIEQDRCLTLALALVDTLVLMEQRKIAHADLSGGNLILPGLKAGASGYPVALVDVEAMFSTQRKHPDVVPSGSPGYAHFLSGAANFWGPKADRFAGALLVSEILGWCDDEVRQARAGETFFEPDSTQQDRQRSALLESSLQSRWGGKVATCFRRAFESPSLDLCPVFEEWRMALLDAGRYQAPRAAPSEPVRQRAQVQGQMDRARKLYEQRRLVEARQLYQEILAEPALPPGLAAELPMMIEDLDKEIAAKDREQRPPDPTYFIPEQAPITPTPHASVLLPEKKSRRPLWMALAGVLMIGATAAWAFAPGAVPPEQPPVPAEAIFQTEPETVTLEVDGMPYSEPLRNGATVKLPEGKHKFAFQAPQRKSLESTVFLGGGQKKTIRATLEWSVGNLTIQSSPAGASIALDGKKLEEKTEASVGELAPRKYKIELSKTGFLPAHKTVAVEAGKTIAVSLTLDRKPEPKPTPKPVPQAQPEPNYYPRPQPAPYRPPAPRPAPPPSSGPWH